MKPSIEDRIKETAETAVIQFLSDPSKWCAPDYAGRLKMPTDILRAAWEMVDVAAVTKKIAVRIESEIADRLMNHLAAEMATDVKQLLSNTERREEIRALARGYIDKLTASGIQ